MFKKSFKIANSHSVANKDRKKIRDQLLAQGYNPKIVENLLDDKQHDNQELLLEKIQGSKVVVYSRAKVPLLFCPDSKVNTFFPTIYLLFQMRDSEIGLLNCFLKAGVESYIFNGADLMWPGIKALNQEEFKVYEAVVIYAKNQNSIQQVSEELSYVPIAVGKMLAGKIPENLKGKAIQIEHYLYDELWNMGPKKIPEEIKFNQDVENTQNNQNDQEENKQGINQNVDQNQSTSAHQDKNKNSTAPQEEEEKKSYEISQEQQNQVEEEKVNPDKNQLAKNSIEQDNQEEQKIAPDEMDQRIIEAFFRSIFEDVKDSDLPMEPSDLQKDYLNMFSDPNFKLDFRLTSYKRIGKFLEVMHKRGIIDYSEPKGLNHKVITKIHRSNEELKTYSPKFSLRKAKKTQQIASGGEEQSGRYPKVEVNEVFQLDKNLNCVLQNVKEISKEQKYFSLKEIRDLLSAYVKENQLDQGASKGCVKLDPILAQIILNRKNITPDNQIAKDKLFQSVTDHIIECYQVVQLDDSEIIKERVKYFRGDIPQVKVHAKRVQNKKQTVITGLELYQIDYDEIVQYLQNKCACSVTTQEIEGQGGAKNPKYEVLIQGNHLDLVAKDILVKRYCISEKYIKKVVDFKGKNK